jgi:hypothetical protein
VIRDSFWFKYTLLSFLFLCVLMIFVRYDVMIMECINLLSTLTYSFHECVVADTRYEQVFYDFMCADITH